MHMPIHQSHSSFILELSGLRAMTKAEIADPIAVLLKCLVKEDGEEIHIDSRPSDAIAVAVTFSPPLPIYVSEHVLEEATSAT